MFYELLLTLSLTLYGINKKQKHAFKYYTADKAPHHRLTFVIVMSILLLLLFDTTLYLCCVVWESIRVHVHGKNDGTYETYSFSHDDGYNEKREREKHKNGTEDKITVFIICVCKSRNKFNREQFFSIDWKPIFIYFNGLWFEM